VKYDPVIACCLHLPLAPSSQSEASLHSFLWW